MMETKVLISYACADGLEASARLRYELQQAGYEVWRDIEEMYGGKDWKKQLRDAIKAVDAVVVLLTPGAVESEYVLWECDTAETVETPLIGLLIVPCDVPDALSHLHYHDLSAPEKYIKGFAQLIRDLGELKSDNAGQDQGNSSSGQFNFNGTTTISQSQFGNGNVMINKGKNPPQED